ncbi:hypothetical protein RRG08_059348 [Elysia crispata]|uniref:Uncharacterized protein n=1 Tax=Elysia crispata TaxID=231223 RepID=A0AAE1BE02_9GAST|nr:hypothetical protein RRG08_059348 [Elysia crispata]
MGINSTFSRLEEDGSWLKQVLKIRITGAFEAASSAMADETKSSSVMLLSATSNLTIASCAPAMPDGGQDSDIALCLTDC